MSLGKLNTHWHLFWDCLVANLDPGWFVWSFWNTNLRHPSLELLKSLSDLWCYTPWPWSSPSLRASYFSSPLSLTEPRLASSHLWAWPGVPSHALHLADPSRPPPWTALSHAHSSPGACPPHLAVSSLRDGRYHLLLLSPLPHCICECSFSKWFLRFLGVSSACPNFLMALILVEEWQAPVPHKYSRWDLYRLKFYWIAMSFYFPYLSSYHVFYLW